MSLLLFAFTLYEDSALHIFSSKKDIMIIMPEASHADCSIHKYIGFSKFETEL